MEDKHRLEQMRHIAQHVNNIPTLPEVMSKVIELVEDPKTTAPQLARFISNDPALTAKILKLSNSAFYGFPQKIGTINLAIVVLGFQSVKDLGLSAAVVEVFNSDEYNICFNPAQFWLHSIAVAAGCKILTNERTYKVSGEIFVAGLLHDIGKLVLCSQLPLEYKRIVDEIQRYGRTSVEVEQDILGFSHADVGGWLMEKWNLPNHQASAVFNHPEPWIAFREPNLAMLVNFSDILSRRAGYIPLEGEREPDLHPKVVDYLKLKRLDDESVDWNHYLEKLNEEMKRAQGFLSVLTQNE